MPPPGDAETLPEIVPPAAFDPDKFRYPAARGARLDPAAAAFFNTDRRGLLERYAALRPAANAAVLDKILSYKPKFLSWAGADLIRAENGAGDRRLLLIETNSCPSGHKAMPELPGGESSCRALLRDMFLPLVRSAKNLPAGSLAVLYDKNPLENSGYAAALAALAGEPVILTPFLSPDSENVRFEDGVLTVRTGDGRCRPIRAAWRYVTQKPWNRLPQDARTRIVNPVAACLAGGRNKILADLAYREFNAELKNSGLEIVTPKTFGGIGLGDVPRFVAGLGGRAVVKNPYSNAGQGVWTIATPEELDAFLGQRHDYARFLVQELVESPFWPEAPRSAWRHVGAVSGGERYAFDLRLMVHAGDDGFAPAALYARRARLPLSARPERGTASWDVLGTNLSSRRGASWETETDRLITAGEGDFTRAGVTPDELVEAFVQTVLAAVAIDRMAERLVRSDGTLDRGRLFSLDDDAALAGEIPT